jgi:hypothetical protein
MNQSGRKTGASTNSRRWFDYQHHSMMIDLCDEPLIHDVD